MGVPSGVDIRSAGKRMRSWGPTSTIPFDPNERRSRAAARSAAAPPPARGERPVVGHRGGLQSGDGSAVPDDVQQLLPGVRIVRSAGTTSYDFKNAGARGGRGRLRRVARRRLRAAARLVALPSSSITDGIPRRRRSAARRSTGPRASCPASWRCSTAATSTPAAPVGAARSPTTMPAFARDVLLKISAAERSRAVRLARRTPRRSWRPAASCASSPAWSPSTAMVAGRCCRHDRRQIGFAMTRYRQLNRRLHARVDVRARRLPACRSCSPCRSPAAGSAASSTRRTTGSGGSRFRVALAVAVPAHAMEMPGIIAALHGGWIGGPAPTVDASGLRGNRPGRHAGARVARLSQAGGQPPRSASGPGTDRDRHAGGRTGRRARALLRPGDLWHLHHPETVLYRRSLAGSVFETIAFLGLLWLARLRGGADRLDDPRPRQQRRACIRGSKPGSGRPSLPRSTPSSA